MTSHNERALEVLAEAVRIRDEAKSAILAKHKAFDTIQPRRSRRGYISKPITYRQCCGCGRVFEDNALWRHQDETGHDSYDMFKIYVHLEADDA